MTDILLTAACFIGVAAAAFLVARSPEFWFGMFLVVGKALWPFIAKRKPLTGPGDSEETDHDKWKQGLPPGQNRHER